MANLGGWGGRVTMAAPNLTEQQVATAFPDIRDLRYRATGGQKIVYTGEINGDTYALKIIEPASGQGPTSLAAGPDDAVARAIREVETMQQCDSPYMVDIGPIGLEHIEIDGTDYIYFTEEFVDGRDLRDVLHQDGVLDAPSLIKLASNISAAIRELWRFDKIHRDIKPGNIMQRDGNGDYILLDMGFIFDLLGESLSTVPVGTLIYFSPEQTNFGERRTVLDFRSDLFSLGIVLYEMATGQHPFVTPTTYTEWDILRNIVSMVPIAPNIKNPQLPLVINDIILRLLSKRPAHRYRTIDLFQRALSEAEAAGGV
jgi:eukaryotic-like serine/threonine-protein kinase